MLTQLANRIDAANAITILSESLSVERAMADWIKTNIPDMITHLWPEIEVSLSMNEEEE